MSAPTAFWEKADEIAAMVRNDNGRTPERSAINRALALGHRCNTAHGLCHRFHHLRAFLYNAGIALIGKSGRAECQKRNRYNRQWK